MPAMIRRLAALATALLLAPVLALAQVPRERFDIERFVVTGNTLLGSEELATVLLAFAGKDRNADDLLAASEAIRERYRVAGFTIAGVIPSELDFKLGTVTLQVVEARIGEVRVVGNQFFDEANIRASLPVLAHGVAPPIASLSASVQLANQNPAKQVDVSLRRGARPGLIDATVEVIDLPPRKFFVTLDNTGTPLTGDYRLGVGVQHANLFGRDHVGTLSFVTSPGKENRVMLYSASYRLPLYELGDSIDAIAAYSDVSAGTMPTVAGPLSFSGKGTVYGLRYNQLLPRRENYSHRLVYGLDYRAYQNDCTLGSFGAASCGPAGVDVTVRPLSLLYSGNATLARQVSNLTVGVSRNLPGGSQGSESAFNAARPAPTGNGGASATYTILRTGGDTVLAFANNWQLRASVYAQLTPDALISGEQFGLAGAIAVRGFSEREIVRDRGYVATLELYTPMVFNLLLDGTGNLRGLLFYDLAVGANHPLPGEESQAVSIASVGVGARWNISRTFNLRVDLARVTDQGGTREVGDYRGHLSLYLEL